jgi:hypothetical protein
MSGSDFNILIGVDMTDAESQIKDKIIEIGKKYPIELEIVLGNKSKFFKQFKTIMNLFKNIGAIDIDLGLQQGSKQADEIKKKIKDIGNTDASHVGDGVTKSMEEAKKQTQALICYVSLKS